MSNLIVWIKQNSLFASLILAGIILLIGLRFGVVAFVMIPIAWLIGKVGKR